MFRKGISLYSFPSFSGRSQIKYPDNDKIADNKWLLIIELVLRQF